MVVVDRCSMRPFVLYFELCVDVLHSDLTVASPPLKYVTTIKNLVCLATVPVCTTLLSIHILTDDLCCGLCLFECWFHSAFFLMYRYTKKEEIFSDPP